MKRRLGRDGGDRTSDQLRRNHDPRRLRLAGTTRRSELRRRARERGRKAENAATTNATNDNNNNNNNNNNNTNGRTTTIKVVDDDTIAKELVRLLKNVRHERDDGEDDQEKTRVGGMFEYGFEREKGLIKEVVTKYLTEGAEALDGSAWEQRRDEGEKEDHENNDNENNEMFQVESTSGS